MSGHGITTRVLDKSLVVIPCPDINLTGKDYWQNATYLGVLRTIAFFASMMF